MKILLIINPCSGRGKIKNELLEILRHFCEAGHKVITYVTSKAGEAKTVVKKASSKNYKLIVCCGGDGTLNEVVTGLMETGRSIPVGYMPAGTTNDFAKTHKIPLKLSKAAEAIINSQDAEMVDIGKFGEDKYFTYIASFGIFTSASYKTQQNAKNALGHMAYVFEGIANLSNVENFQLSYKIDGKKYKGDYIYGGISNTTSVGGIFKYDTKLVDLSDGLFEVLLIKTPKNPNDIMKIITGITTSDFSDKSTFEFHRASKIEFEMSTDVTWSLDGEAAEGERKFVIENIPKSISFVK